jgi:hypothetical protein
VLPAGLTNVLAISSGAYHSLALKGEKDTLHLQSRAAAIAVKGPTTGNHRQWMKMAIGFVALAVGIIVWWRMKFRS